MSKMKFTMTLFVALVLFFGSIGVIYVLCPKDSPELEPHSHNSHLDVPHHNESNWIVPNKIYDLGGGMVSFLYNEGSAQATFERFTKENKDVLELVYIFDDQSNILALFREIESE